MSHCDTPLDGAAALARLGGNAALLRELAAMFLEDYPNQIAEVGERLRCGDAPGLRHAAHQLRGALACLEANAAREAAKAVEEAARVGDLNAAAHACDALTTALQHLAPALTVLATAGGHQSAPLARAAS